MTVPALKPIPCGDSCTISISTKATIPKVPPNFTTVTLDAIVIALITPALLLRRNALKERITMTAYFMTAELPIASYVMTPCAWTVALVLERMSVTHVMISLPVHHLASARAQMHVTASWNDASIAQGNVQHAKLTTLLTTM